MSKIYTAQTADLYELYEEAVQNVEFEVDSIIRFYRKYRNKNPQSLKEDFCGTFALGCEWVKRDKTKTAIGVDLDSKPLNWGKKNHVSKLNSDELSRIELFQKNVLEVTKPQVDCTAAFNFSYWIFDNPKTLLNYFVKSYIGLKKDGIFVLDAFGGPMAEEEQEEERDCEGFKYVWEHAFFYPVTRQMGCKIHFHFNDGTKKRNAFTYQWRLWTPPEITDLLKLAGFKSVNWYWEGTDKKTGDGNGIFRETKKGENAQTWIAYIVALK